MGYEPNSLDLPAATILVERRPQPLAGSSANGYKCKVPPAGLEPANLRLKRPLLYAIELRRHEFLYVTRRYIRDDAFLQHHQNTRR